MVEVQRTKPRRFTRNWGHLNALSAPAVALLIDHGLLDGFPLEATQQGLRFVHSAPELNVYRRALLGYGEPLTEHLPKGATSLPADPV